MIMRRFYGYPFCFLYHTQLSLPFYNQYFTYRPLSLAVMTSESVYYQNAQYIYKHKCDQRDPPKMISLRGHNPILESIMHLYS
jgi:hypothetical protein